MASSTVISITHGTENTQTVKNVMRGGTNKSSSTNPKELTVRLRNFFHAVCGGMRMARITIACSDNAMVAAAGKITPAQASITAGDKIYVGSVPFVATNGAVTLGEATFDMRTSTAAVCTSLAAQINAHASLTGIMSATDNTTYVGLTAVQKGAVGTHIALAKVNSNNAAAVLNGNANTVLITVLGDATTGSTAGTGGNDASPVTISRGV